MLSYAAIALGLLFSDPSSEVVRFGGEAAVPARDASPDAPVEVAPRPFKPDALFRTQSGAWRYYDAAKDRVVPVPLVGEHLIGWSPNGGSVLTSLGAGRLMRWKYGTWAQIGDFALSTTPDSAVMSPDGHHIMVAGKNPDDVGRRFMLFGGQIGMALQKLDRLDAVQLAPMASSDERVAIVRADRIEILRLPRLEAERELMAPDAQEIVSMAFGAEGGELVALRIDREEVEVERWSIATGASLGKTELPRGCRRGVLSSNGRLAACLLDKPTRALVIDLPAGTTRATIPAPDRTPVFDANSARLAFPGNRAVPIWDATIDGVLPPTARAGAVTAMAIAVDGSVAALESNGVARVWDPAAGTETFRVAKPANALAASNDGAILYAATPALTAIEESTGKTLWTVRGTKPVAVVLAPTGDRIFWMEPSGEIKVRGVDAKAKPKRLAKRPKATPATRGQPLDTRLAIASDGAVLLAGGRVLDAKTGRVLREIRSGPAAFAATTVVGLGADGLPVSEDGKVAFAGTRSEVTALAGNDRWLVAGTREGALHVWTPDGRVVVERSVHRGAVGVIVIDGARNRVYSAGADGVILGIALP